MTTQPPPGGPPRTYWAQAPRGNARTAMSAAKLLAVFAAILAGIVLLAAVLIAAFAPTPPPPTCQPGEACGGPPGTPPPITGDRTPEPGATATPAGSPSPSTPAVGSPSPSATTAPTSGPSATRTPPPDTSDLPAPIAIDADVPPLRTWPMQAGPEGSYRLFHPPYLTPTVRPDGSIVIGAAIPAQEVEVAMRVNTARAPTSPNELLEQMVEDFRGRISSMVLDDGPESRIHRPSIGHLPAIARSYRGDLGSAGSVRPVALVVMAATDGRTTVAINVLVIDPDAVFPGAEKRWFRLAGSIIDPILKRFEWGSGT